ncbi:MAG: 3-oxoacyl-[acyl-carrier-protein] reductase [Gammaproteobacteria bacterium]|nr:3-oxoacyl-[acyl-carrier-protein] reductase [Gammaproteobacteria bacterium]|tara:strand:- start:1613 stop:2389 length:777 start_codon:yes stop_codon:yes gene_type:complete
MPEKPVALITAGASGIGRAIADCLLKNDYRVHLSDVNPDTIGECLEVLTTATASQADASKVGDVDRVFEDLESHYGRLDVLVNNVGVAGPTAPVEEIDPEEWDRTISIDLSSAFYAVRRAVPLLKKQGGSIINIASNAAMSGLPLRSPYTASKWALIGLAKTWAMELGCNGIRVNAICPGSVNGPRIDGVIDKDAQQRGLSADAVRDVYLRQSSMRVFVDAVDVAEAVRFLCSPAGRYISGQSIGVDGHTEGLSNWLD